MVLTLSTIGNGMDAGQEMKPQQSTKNFITHQLSQRVPFQLANAAAICNGGD